MVYQEVGRGRSRLYEEIVSQIQNLVIQGHFRLGDKLPPEIELVEQFGVSKTVVREAIRALEERGLVTVKHGRGAYVSQPSSASISDSISLLLQTRRSSLLALHEIREILEIEIARLAAERATDEEIAQMEQAVQREAQILGSPQEYVEADLGFHELLAKAAHNEVVPILLNPLADLMRESRRVLREDKPVTVEPTASAEMPLPGHGEVLAAIKSRDVEQAREVMRQHLQVVRRHLEQLAQKSDSLKLNE